jgi:hypothetical protein
MHGARTTPLGHGNRPGTNKSAKPKRPAGERYTTASYRRAICWGCELAYKMPDDLRKGPADETMDQKQARLNAARRWRRSNT